MADTFGVQTDIAEEISSALGVVLDDTQLALMRDAGVREPEAFIALQKGFEAFDAAHGTAEQIDLLREANAWFEKALEIQPGISDAHMLHADHYTHILLSSVDNPEISVAEQKAAYERLVINRVVPRWQRISRSSRVTGEVCRGFSHNWSRVVAAPMLVGPMQSPRPMDERMNSA
jgi:hypothetical protein